MAVNAKSEKSAYRCVRRALPVQLCVLPTIYVLKSAYSESLGMVPRLVMVRWPTRNTPNYLQSAKWTGWSSRGWRRWYQRAMTEAGCTRSTSWCSPSLKSSFIGYSLTLHTSNSVSSLVLKSNIWQVKWGVGVDECWIFDFDSKYHCSVICFLYLPSSFWRKFILGILSVLWPFDDYIWADGLLQRPLIADL